MQQHSRTYWLLAAVVLAGMILAAWAGRPQLEAWTRERLAGQHERTLAEHAEPQAAALIAQLADDDLATLALLVAALGEPREQVAAAAESALLARLDRWGGLRTADSSTRVGALASALAQQAEALPEERRELAQHIAQRLIAWPVDRQGVAAGRLIADCEVVLRLERSPPPEIHIATLELRTPLPEEPASERPTDTALQQPVENPIPSVVPAPPPPELPRAILPTVPDPLPGAGQETPAEPRRFLPPRGIGSVSD